MSKINPADIAAAEYLEKERRDWTKKENLLVTVLFTAFVFGLFLLFILLPKKEFSKKENKALPEFPEFSVTALKNGKFTSELQEYIRAHFPARDAFMEISSAYELSKGSLGNGGVIAGKDGYLLSEEQPFTKTEQKAVTYYKAQIDRIAAQAPTVVAVAGKGSEVMTDRFPGVIDISAIGENRAYVDEVLGNGQYVYLNLAEELKKHGSEEIYYRTDHHWTALGAYYGSAAALRALGKEPMPLESYRKETATPDFRGTLYNSSGMFWHKGENLDFMRYEGDDGYTVTYCTSNGKEIGTSSSLYDLSCLEEDHRGTAYDTYIAPVTVSVVRVEKEGDRPTLLLLKDSFAHSAVPYLAQQYNVIWADIRYGANINYAESLIRKGEIDAVLVLVNTETLTSVLG